MKRARSGKHLLRLKGKATVEAIAKASVERKRIITEVVPPDVIRSKAGRWLDLISPITEWAGLKGDVLRHKRGLLRIQQEAALDALAGEILTRFRPGEVKQPLVSRFLVPALEAASLETPDSPLIGWWADLLTSGAKGGSTRPYLVELMKQIGPEEANVLEKLWTAIHRGSFHELCDPHFNLADVVPMMLPVTLQSHLYLDDGEAKGGITTTEDKDYHFNERVTQFLKWAEEQGIPARMTISTPKGGIIWPSSAILTQAAPTLDVLCALNIVAFHSSGRQRLDDSGQIREIEIRSLHFTKLGAEFMRACRPVKQT